MSNPILHHSILKAPEGAEQYMICLHGIFGMGRNWTTFVQRLIRSRPRWGIVLVDLRLHGRSRDFPPPHTLEACVADLKQLIERIDRPVKGVMGHSFGGKVALKLAREQGEGTLGLEPLEQVWVLDSTPAPFPTASSASMVLEVMRSLPMPMDSRAEVIGALEARGLTPAISQWLATNVEPIQGRFVWRFDFDGLESLLRDYYQTDLWGVIERPPTGTRIHMVKAERSDVLTPEDCTRIEAAGRQNGRVMLHILPDSDHWLHVDNPDGLQVLMEPWL